MGYLTQEDIIAEGDSYGRFCNVSRNLLKAGSIQEYFAEWQKFMRSVFHRAVGVKSEEFRAQAEELIGMKKEMNEVLERQLENGGDEEALQMVEEYKQIFGDLRQLMR